MRKTLKDEIQTCVIFHFFLNSHYSLSLQRDQTFCQTCWFLLVMISFTFQNFQEFDSEGNGVIQPRDLKKVLFRFGIPITLEEFKQLWARYDNSK